MSARDGSRWGPGAQATAVSLGLAAVVWLAWLLVVVPGGRDAAPDTAAPSPVAAQQEQPAPPAATATGAAAAAAQEDPPVPTTYDVFLTRDPFEPVVPGEDADGQPPDDTTDGQPPGDTTDGQHTHDAGSDDPCTGDQEVVCDGRVVTLVDITTAQDGTPTATIRVDTTDYQVREDEVFAENFRVLSIEPPCVTLLFGDDSFQICRGEEVLK